MLRLIGHHRCTAWATLAALVLATLTPTLSHAMRHARGDAVPWTQLCSGAGVMRHVAITLGADGAPVQHGHAFERCTYCAAHDGASALPAPAPATAVIRSAAQAQPAYFAPAPWPQLAWRAAWPRAPPRQA